MAKDSKEMFEEKEAQARFEAALMIALNTPHKPLKEEPRVKKKSPTKKEPRRSGVDVRHTF